jgi:hypothetical protein
VIHQHERKATDSELQHVMDRVKEAAYRHTLCRDCQARFGQR